VQLLAHREAAKLSPSGHAALDWLLHFGDYLVIGVIPYAGPFILAIWLDAELRARILGWAAPAIARQSAPKPARRRNR
jgi:hypothetical protein